MRRALSAWSQALVVCLSLSGCLMEVGSEYEQTGAAVVALDSDEGIACDGVAKAVATSTADIAAALGGPYTMVTHGSSEAAAFGAVVDALLALLYAPDCPNTCPCGRAPASTECLPGVQAKTPLPSNDYDDWGSATATELEPGKWRVKATISKFPAGLQALQTCSKCKKKKTRKKLNLGRRAS